MQTDFTSRNAGDRMRSDRARRQRGFTLIELMAACAVIAILAGLGLPNYMDNVRRSRLSDAFQTMTQFRTKMEQAFQDNGNYGAVGGSCSVATPAASAYFSFACTLGSTGQSFSMTATGTGSMAGYAYFLDDAGNQRTTAFPHATVPVACWLNRAGAC